jgi:hypothetical protein
MRTDCLLFGAMKNCRAGGIRGKIEMKRFRFSAVLMAFAATLCVCFAQPTFAASSSFSFQLGEKSVDAGSTVPLIVKVGAGSGVAGLRLRVSYDASVLRLAGVSPSQQIEAGTLQTNTASNPICSVYVCNVGLGYAPPLSGTFIVYYFHVLEDAPAGETNVCVCVDETCDYSAQNLSLDKCETLPLSVSAAASSEAALTDLRPSAGELSPPFSPDVFSYRLRVDSSVSSVTFQANASDGASVVISRKSLTSPGSETPISILVTAADKKTKSVYLVTVSRAAKAESGGKESSSAKTVFSEKPPAGEKESSLKAGRDFATEAESALAAAQKKKSVSSAALEVAATVLAGQKPAVQAAASAAAAPLTVVQDRMPTYLIGLLAAEFCIVTGIVLSLWLGRKKK